MNPEASPRSACAVFPRVVEASNRWPLLLSEGLEVPCHPFFNLGEANIHVVDEHCPDQAAVAVAFLELHAGPAPKRKLPHPGAGGGAERLLRFRRVDACEPDDVAVSALVAHSEGVTVRYGDDLAGEGVAYAACGPAERKERQPGEVKGMP